MRTRNFLVAAALALGLLGGLVYSPAQAAPKKFETTLAFPGADAGTALADEIACPGGGEGDGLFYKFFDLEGDFTHFKVEGPTRLFTDPSGTTNIGDYDLDLYVFDAKCNSLGDANTEASTESYSTKKPARFVRVDYYSGIHPELPITLQVDNEKIK